jgi:c-di-AMP phosphodiesterase-like protein
MMMYMGKGIKLTKTEAEGLLAGITVDTKNFAFKTGVKTFEASAYLKRNGADTISVRRLFRSSFEDYSAKVDVVKSAEIIHDNMAISVLNKPVDNPTVLIAQAADEMLGINGIEVSYVLCAIGDNVYISARSLGTVNVQKLMERLGGGGHQTGAAAQLSNMDIAEATELLKKKIDEYLNEI